MNKIWMIAWNNIKRKKSDSIVMVCLILLAVLMLYVSISVLSGGGRVLDEAFERVNAPDVEYVLPRIQEEKVVELLTGQSQVKEVETTPCLLLNAYYYGAKNPEEQVFIFLLGEMETERKIGTMYAAESGEKQKDSIILPYYFKSGFGYEVGDNISLELGDKYYDFTVQGFGEDPFFASPLNISVYKCYVTGTFMEELLEEQEALQINACYNEYKIRLQEGEDDALFEQRMMPELNREIPELNQGMVLGLYWQIMRGGNMMMSNIGMALLLVFALLLISIVLVIIRFSIRNFVEENMENTGIMQAAGYTAVQLRGAVLTEIGLLSGLGAAFGILAGSAGSSIVGRLEASLIGLPWNAGFDVSAACIAALGCMVICLFIAAWITRIYKRITVLEALRGGIRTHNFKRNPLPLHKSILPLPLSLGIKNIWMHKVRNGSILCIVGLLALVSCTGFGMYQNFAQDTGAVLKISGVEMGTLSIEMKQETDFDAEELEKLEGVEKVLLYNSADIKLSAGGEPQTVTCDYWDKPEELENEMLLEGKLPEYDNEIVLTTNVAERLGVGVGDVIYVEGTGEKLDYYVCGIDQKINNMGIKAMLNFQGVERLNGSAEAYLAYVYGKEGVSYDELNKEIVQKWPGCQTVDSESTAAGSIRIVTTIMTVLCILFLGVSVTTVFLIVYLLVQSQVIRERRNYGIYKALGFTTGQLVFQSVFCNLPVIGAGAVLGALLAPLTGEPVLRACMSVFGIKSYEMPIDIQWILLTIAGIVLTGFVTAVLCSLKIRRVEAVKLIVGE